MFTGNAVIFTLPVLMNEYIYTVFLVPPETVVAAWACSPKLAVKFRAKLCEKSAFWFLFFNHQYSNPVSEICPKPTIAAAPIALKPT